MLPVQYAFHSAQMAPFQHQLVEQLGGVRGGAAHGCRVFHRDRRPRKGCALRRSLFRSQCARTGTLRRRHRCDGRRRLRRFLEIGPHPVLASSIAECLSSREHAPAVLASLRRGRPERETLLQACAGAYAAGCDLDWEHVQPTVGQVVELPGYPWQRKRHWIRARPARSAVLPAAGHPHARAPNSGGRDRGGDF